MKALILLSSLFFLLSSANSQAQQRLNKIQKAQLTIDAECHMCEELIEEELRFAKGVVYANVILEKKILSVKFNSKKTNVDAIKQLVSKLGYTCDGLEADSKAKNNRGHVCEEHKGHHHHH